MYCSCNNFNYKEYHNYNPEFIKLNNQLVFVTGAHINIFLLHNPTIIHYRRRSYIETASIHTVAW
jgi:hypothetical protein